MRTGVPSKGGRDILTRNSLDNRLPAILIIRPPSRARTMRTRSAKTVPPGAAMGPRIVQAERKIELVVRRRVR